jgi:hypothetical protein
MIDSLEYFLSDDSDVFWRHIGTIPSFEINLEYVRLEKEAKLTDFLSYYPNLHHGGGFLLSEKALEILTSHRLPPYEIYNAQVYSYLGEKISSKYKLLYCPPLAYDFINFEKTRFFEGSRILGKKIFSIRSGAEFEKLKENKLFQSEKIFLNASFDDKLDYFLTKVSMSNIFISERLKESLITAGMAGLNIVEVTEPIIELQ